MSAIDRLRVVVVMIEPPLPFGDATARWYYVLLKGLVARGHRVTALAACSKPADLSAARDLFPAPEYDLRCFPFPDRRGWRSKWETARRPFSYMFGPDLRDDLAATLASGFDVLHLESLWSGWLGLAHADRALVNVHYLVAIDKSELRPENWRERVDRDLLRATERRLIRSFRFFRAVSPRLVGPIERINPRADVEAVPLGLDSTLYPLITDDHRLRAPVVSLIGTMRWTPTYSAAIRLLTRLWPEIKRRVPEARLEVVGWSARAKLSEFLDRPDVTIVEDVPETRPYFERAGVLLYAPGRGSGMKVKVLEAMAFGVPVVTTSEGVEGLPAEDGIHAGVCDDDEGLVDRTVALLRDPARQDRQRLAARRLLETHCGPDQTLDGIEKLYRKLHHKGTKSTKTDTKGNDFK